MKRIANNRTRRKYRVTNDQHQYLVELAHKLSIASGKKIEMSDVLGGIIDHYKGTNEKAK